MVQIPKALHWRTPINGTERNMGLVLLHCICATLVVIFLTNNYYYLVMNVNKNFFLFGHLAQDFFFSMSGFFIGKQILHFINVNQPNILGFYRNRWMRTYILYLIFLVINYGLFHFFCNRTHLFLLDLAKFNIFEHLFFSQNLAQQLPYFYPEIWSLSFEKCSFLIILLVIIAAVWLRKKTLSHLSLVACLLVLILLACFLSFTLDSDTQIDWGIRKIPMDRLDAIVYVVLILILLTLFYNYSERPLLLKWRNKK